MMCVWKVHPESPWIIFFVHFSIEFMNALACGLGLNTYIVGKAQVQHICVLKKY